MITLNILPPTIREDLKVKNLYLTLKNIVESFLVFTIFIAIILLICRFILQNNFNEVVAQTTLIATTYQELDKEIKVLNSELRKISNLQKDFIPWSKAIVHFSQITPNDIKIASFELNRESKKINIGGEAKTRNALLQFKENLEKSEIFSDIESPISNILLQKDIDFQFSAKLVLEKIK